MQTDHGLLHARFGGGRRARSRQGFGCHDVSIAGSLFRQDQRSSSINASACLSERKVGPSMMQMLVRPVFSVNPHLAAHGNIIHQGR